MLRKRKASSSRRSVKRGSKPEPVVVTQEEYSANGPKYFKLASEGRAVVVVDAKGKVVHVRLAGNPLSATERAKLAKVLDREEDALIKAVEKAQLVGKAPAYA